MRRSTVLNVSVQLVFPDQGLPSEVAVSMRRQGTFDCSIYFNATQKKSTPIQGKSTKINKFLKKIQKRLKISLIKIVNLIFK